jgi:hypothetical protein
VISQHERQGFGPAGQQLCGERTRPSPFPPNQPGRLSGAQATPSVRESMSRHAQTTRKRPFRAKLATEPRPVRTWEEQAQHHSVRGNKAPHPVTHAPPRHASRPPACTVDNEWGKGNEQETTVPKQHGPTVGDADSMDRVPAPHLLSGRTPTTDAPHPSGGACSAHACIPSSCTGRAFQQNITGPSQIPWPGPGSSKTGVILARPCQQHGKPRASCVGFV